MPIYTTSWFGNTFNGNPKVVQRRVDGFWVGPDGTCYATAIWDESALQAAMYRNGDFVGKLPGGNGRNAGGYFWATRAITGDSKNVYFSVSVPNPATKGARMWCIGRDTLAGQVANWPGQTDNLLKLVDAPTDQVSDILGMAAANGEVYVATQAPDMVWVVNADTGAIKNKFAASFPSALAADKAGRIWVVERNAKAGTAIETDSIASGFTIRAYTPDGKPTGAVIENPGRPLGLAVDHLGRLMVADDSARQQIVIYDVTGAQPREVATFGQRGGINGGVDGEGAPLKLPYPAGVGEDAAGNIYVASRYPSTGGCEIRSFTASGTPNWRLLNTEFQNTADADPGTDGQMVYTPYAAYKMDYSKADGKEATLVGETIDKFRFPGDPRLHGDGLGPMVRHVGGHTLMYLIGQGSRIAIFRKEDNSQIFVPCGFWAASPFKQHAPNDDFPPSQPARGSYFWRDSNADGKWDASELIVDDGAKTQTYMKGGYANWVDSNGDIWSVAGEDEVLRLPLKGFDSHGAPEYDFSNAVNYGPPQGFAKAPFEKKISYHINRMVYEASSDTLYVTGYTDGDFATPTTPRGLVYDRVLGPELFCYTDFTKPTRKLTYRIALPYSRTDQTAGANGLNVAGPYMLIAAVGGGGNQNKVWVYDKLTGTQLGAMTPGANIGPFGWIDIVYGTNAYQQANGETVMFLEDVWKEKQVMFRITPK